MNLEVARLRHRELLEEARRERLARQAGARDRRRGRQRWRRFRRRPECGEAGRAAPWREQLP